MIEDQVEGLAPPPSTHKEYTFREIFDYFDYILELVGDDYPMNIFTPEEFKKGEFDDD